jgi:LmbE family N-acetylglucosaminyl deacetylase
MFRRFCTSLLALALIACAGIAHAQAPATPPPGDPRFKADLLLLVAHPDDDVLAGSYLAKAALDQGRKVAVVFVTRGDAGGNQVGVERAASLGLIREMGARRDLATLGITNVWFLGGRDTPSQNPLLSLANWDHGRTLGEAVRLVRLTRPEVILTWLPMPVVGENHGDHQAAAILATEAFDMAADPTVFPSQVTPSTGVFEP